MYFTIGHTITLRTGMYAVINDIDQADRLLRIQFANGDRKWIHFYEVEAPYAVGRDWGAAEYRAAGIL